MSNAQPGPDGASIRRIAPDDSRVLARSLAYLFFAGGALGFASLALPMPAGADQLAIVVLSGVALVVAVCALLFGERIPRWGFHVLVGLGTVCVTAAAYKGGGEGRYALFYLWIGLYAFYFFSRKGALVHVGAVAVAYGVVLHAGEMGQATEARWLLLVGTLLVASTLVAELAKQVGERAAEAAARAEQLDEAERRTRSILETANDAFISMDAQGIVTAWNPAAELIFGWARAEALGRNLADLIIPEEQRAAHAGGLERFLMTGAGPILDRRIELTALHRSGRRFPIEALISPLRTGETYSFNAFLHDITERHASERRLRESEERFRLLIDGVRDHAIFSLAPSGHVVSWNSGAERLYGWSEGEIVGEEASTFFVEEDRAEGRPARMLADAARDGRLEEEGWCVRSDGSRFWADAVLTARRDENGVLEGFSTIIRDVSERRLAEKRIREQAEDLAVIARVTRELSSITHPEDARSAVCRAATEVAGSDVAIMFEPGANGRELESTAGEGLLAPIRLPFTGEPSGAAVAFTTLEPFFVADLAHHPSVAKRIVADLDVASAMWQPVLHNGLAVGVLTVAWREPMEELSDRVRDLVGLLATEAAVAIERANLMTRLEAVARTDDLTGLANRRAWDEELPRELARAKREDRPVCVAMLDLDRFKDFNDQHGHPAGDRLLKQLASVWREQLRPTDFIARYGGEEFGMVLPNCEMELAVTVIERLRDAVPVGQTCSAGVATWDGSETADKLVARADSALYNAKAAGRDRTVSAA